MMRMPTLRDHAARVALSGAALSLVVAGAAAVARPSPALASPSLGSAAAPATSVISYHYGSQGLWLADVDGTHPRPAYQAPADGLAHFSGYGRLSADGSMVALIDAAQKFDLVDGKLVRTDAGQRFVVTATDGSWTR